MSKDRTKRRASASLVLLICIALLGIAVAQTAVAGAARTSPVGSYRMSYWLTNTSPGSKTFPLVLKRSGRFSLTVPLMKVGSPGRPESRIPVPSGHGDTRRKTMGGEMVRRAKQLLNG